jgi:hypothetical protein
MKATAWLRLRRYGAQQVSFSEIVGTGMTW